MAREDHYDLYSDPKMREEAYARAQRRSREEKKTMAGGNMPKDLGHLVRDGFAPRTPQELESKSEEKAIRVAPTGATRDQDISKLDFEGFLSPLVLKRYAEYMNKNRLQKDGSIRASDNWQLGMPLEWYIKSHYRHFMDWWLHHRGHPDAADEDLETALCAVMFNVMGYLHETLRAKRSEGDDDAGSKDNT